MKKKQYLKEIRRMERELGLPEGDANMLWCKDTMVNAYMDLTYKVRSAESRPTQREICIRMNQGFYRDRDDTSIKVVSVQGDDVVYLEECPTSRGTCGTTKAGMAELLTEGFRLVDLGDLRG
jgi:hypothetical protein